MFSLDTKCIGAKICAVMALAIPMALASPSAHALECGKRDAVTKILDSRFQETRRAMGLASNMGLMEVYVSKKGTWTVLLTTPAGMSCIVAAGDSWEDAPYKVAEPAA